jgi:cyclase
MQASHDLKVVKVKDSLYVLQDPSGGNSTLYVTAEGPILVDDKLPGNFDDIVASVKSVTDKPVRYVFNTHYHFDHTGSNTGFLATAPVIAHENARRSMLKSNQPGAPSIVFGDRMSVLLGGREIQALHYGSGHTDGDSLVYFPADRVLCTGDLMAGATPLIDYNGGGSVKAWIATLNRALKELDFDTVIPGHGPVTSREMLATFVANTQKLADRVATLVKEGKSKEDVAKMLTAEFAWPPGGFNMQLGLDGLYKEMK